MGNENSKVNQASLRPGHTVICVDDEPLVLSSLTRLLFNEEYATKVMERPSQVIDWVKKSDVSLVLADQMMPEMTGSELGKAIKAISPNTMVGIITSHTKDAAISKGVESGYIERLIEKPWGDKELKNAIVELLQERERLEHLEPHDKLEGVSSAIVEIHRLIEKVGPTDATVLITGETGTGKELIARAIHDISPRRERPFIAVNCGSIPDTLLESMLFGHMRGAFTGADRNKRGLFEVAEDGTIFLDEIGEMPASLQPKILRALETREILPVGSTTPIKISCRVLTATNRNLADMMQKSIFRSDLYYRLNVFDIHIPPLRERPEDIPLITENLLKRLCRKMTRQSPALEPDALSAIERYPWPGNVRELSNVLERALILAEGSLISKIDLPAEITTLKGMQSDNLKESLLSFEQKHIHRVVAKCGNDKRRAAHALGINLSSLYRKLNIRIQKHKQK